MATNAPLPSLVVDIDEARTKLATQIEKGKELQKAAAGSLSDRMFDELWRKERSWHEYTETLLRSLFDSDEMAKKFVNDTSVFEWAVVRTRRSWDTFQEIEERSGSDDHESLRQRISNKIHFLTSLSDRLELHPHSPQKTKRPRIGGSSAKVFIVHGHDKAAKESTIRFVEKLALTPLVFDESPNKGRTIIEKLEDLGGDAAFAIVLFTPDDVGGVAGRQTKLQRRARQNVVFELGFFAGLLGRNRVCLLHKGDAEIPSDLHGVLYVNFDDHEGWHVRLAREMKAAELAFDFNQIL